MKDPEGFEPPFENLDAEVEKRFKETQSFAEIFEVLDWMQERDYPFPDVAFKTHDESLLDDASHASLEARKQEILETNAVHPGDAWHEAVSLIEEHILTKDDVEFRIPGLQEAVAAVSEEWNNGDIEEGENYYVADEDIPKVVAELRAELLNIQRETVLKPSLAESLEEVLRDIESTKYHQFAIQKLEELFISAYALVTARRYGGATPSLVRKIDLAQHVLTKTMPEVFRGGNFVETVINLRKECRDQESFRNMLIVYLKENGASLPEKTRAEIEALIDDQELFTVLYPNTRVFSLLRKLPKYPKGAESKTSVE